MILSTKDIRFIVEAIESQLKIYQESFEKAENNHDEDKISELGNDIQYLKLLLTDLNKNLEKVTQNQ